MHAAQPACDVGRIYVLAGSASACRSSRRASEPAQVIGVSRFVAFTSPAYWFRPIVRETHRYACHAWFRTRATPDSVSSLSPTPGWGIADERHLDLA